MRQKERTEDNNEIFTVKTEGVDVNNVMKKIRDKIAKRKLYLFTKDELDELTETTFLFPPLPGEIGDELAYNFESPERSWNLNIEEALKTISSDSGEWNLNPAYDVKSHRKFVGILIIVMKKLVHPLIRLYTDFVVFKQARINHEFYNLIKEQGRINQYLGFINHNLIKELTKTKLQNDSLDYSINQLKSEVEFLKKREKALEKLIDIQK
jgi:hypothetical protein